MFFRERRVRNATRRAVEDGVLSSPELHDLQILAISLGVPRDVINQERQAAFEKETSNIKRRISRDGRCSPDEWKQLVHSSKMHQIKLQFSPSVVAARKMWDVDNGHPFVPFDFSEQMSAGDEPCYFLHDDSAWMTLRKRRRPSRQEYDAACDSLKSTEFLDRVVQSGRWINSVAFGKFVFTETQFRLSGDTQSFNLAISSIESVRQSGSLLEIEKKRRGVHEYVYLPGPAGEYVQHVFYWLRARQR